MWDAFFARFESSWTAATAILGAVVTVVGTIVGWLLIVGEKAIEQRILNQYSADKEAARSRLRLALSGSEETEARCDHLVGGLDDWRMILTRSGSVIRSFKRAQVPAFLVLGASALSIVVGCFYRKAGAILALFAGINIVWLIIVSTPVVLFFKRHGLPVQSEKSELTAGAQPSRTIGPRPLPSSSSVGEIGTKPRE